MAINVMKKLSAMIDSPKGNIKPSSKPLMKKKRSGKGSKKC